MKNKLTAILLLCIAALFSFSGCQGSNSDGYSAYYIDGSDSVSLHEQQNEFAPWSTEKLNYFNDSTAVATKTVSFEGKNYSGEYYSSYVTVPNLFTSHKYLGNNCTFDINAQTGKITAFNLFSDITETFTIDEKQGRDIADNYAKDYINLENYTVNVTKNDTNNNCFYVFEYYREINGYKTNDLMTVCVDGKGEVVSFSCSMLGAFNNARTATIDKSKADAALVKMLEKLFADYSDWTYDIEDTTLIVKEDGKQGILYSVVTETLLPSDIEDQQVHLRHRSEILITE